MQSVSTEHLLTCLELAIDEAKLVRSLIQSKDIVRVLKEKKPFSERLVYLNKEIRCVHGEQADGSAKQGRCSKYLKR